MYWPKYNIVKFRGMVHNFGLLAYENNLSKEYLGSIPKAQASTK
jgi:hypothetical protein